MYPVVLSQSHVKVLTDKYAHPLVLTPLNDVNVVLHLTNYHTPMHNQSTRSVATSHAQY